MLPARADAPGAPLFLGCVVLFLGDGPALRGAYAKALADVIRRNGGESVTLQRKASDAAAAARATHVLSGAEAAEAAAAALAAAFPPELCVRNLPLLSPRWVYECAATRRLLPWQDFTLRPRVLSPPRRPLLPRVAERNVALAELLDARGAELAAAHGGCGHRAGAFAAAAAALRTQVPFEVTAASLARLQRHAHAHGGPPGWTGLRCGDAPLDALHAALGAPPPLRMPGLAAAPPPGQVPEAQPHCRLLQLASPLLCRILASLPPAALVRVGATCRALHRAAFSGLPTAAVLRVMTWNVKNNGEDRHSGQPRGVGCQVWDVRRCAVAAAVAAQAPAVLCLQEDKDAMLTALFATSALAHSTLRCYPQPGQRCEDAPVLALPDDPPGADAPPPAGAPPPWERCCVLWDDALLQCVHAGQFRWRDGRVVLQGRREGQREHFLPLTWLLLRWRAHVDGRAGCFLVLNAHFEAGHHWLNDVPAKLRSAALFSAVASALRARFGAHVPMLAAGDFNMQKTQLQYRVLVGDPGAGVLPTHTPARLRVAAARVPVQGSDEVAVEHLARFVDAFDAWMHDCPRLDDVTAPAVPAPAGTVGAPGLRRARTGGHDGTTWHAFVNAASAVKVSDSMRDTQVQHRSMADGADGGARGHQRHIDAIMLCAAASVRGAARVRSARVLKRRGQCGFAGGCALLRLRGNAGDEEGEEAACCSGEGGWGSDHFPVVADVTLFFQQE